MVTVGKAARMFGLSRTALLYYESIGLLTLKRADNGYRMYGAEDIERLRQIITLRNAGVPLGEISECLSSPGSGVYSILLKRLSDINAQIEKYRRQQDVIIKLLKDTDLKRTRRFKTEEWMDILRRAGVEEGAALAWHIQFETQSPEQHKSLLRALGFSPEETASFKRAYEAQRKAGAADNEDDEII